MSVSISGAWLQKQHGGCIEVAPVKLITSEVSGNVGLNMEGVSCLEPHGVMTPKLSPWVGAR